MGYFLAGQQLYYHDFFRDNALLVLLLQISRDNIEVGITRVCHQMMTQSGVYHRRKIIALKIIYAYELKTLTEDFIALRSPKENRRWGMERPKEDRITERSD